MTANRDEDSGKFTEQYSRETFVKAVDSIENATTSQVAEEIGCSYDLAYRRLNALEESNEVSSTKIGSSFVWSQ